eukprot:jgi/Hompol1/1657/HPOL_001383-RA
MAQFAKSSHDALRSSASQSSARESDSHSLQYQLERVKSLPSLDPGPASEWAREVSSSPTPGMSAALARTASAASMTNRSSAIAVHASPAVVTAVQNLGSASLRQTGTLSSIASKHRQAEPDSTSLAQSATSSRQQWSFVSRRLKDLYVDISENDDNFSALADKYASGASVMGKPGNDAKDPQRNSMSELTTLDLQ